MHDFERVTRNVVRTFYDPPPTNDSNEPIWLLGQRYDPRPPPSKPTPTGSPSAGTPTPQSERNEDESWIRTSIEETERREAPNGEDPAQYGNWPSAFLDDFESRIWMTYRSGFTAIQKSQDPKATSAMSFRVRMQNLASPGFTSDTGFGCMIRSGQCILANALQILRLGRDWRYQEKPDAKEHQEILSMFADDPKAPFSIHRFVEHGAAVCGKYPGEWFGPSAAARCIQDLVHKNKEAGLRVYVSGDGADVYEDKLKEIAMEDDGEWQPTNPSRHEVGHRQDYTSILGSTEGEPADEAEYWYCRWPTISVTLLCSHAGEQLLLPRPPQHMPTPTLPPSSIVHRERGRSVIFHTRSLSNVHLVIHDHCSFIKRIIFRRRTRNLPHTPHPPSSDPRDGPLHAPCIPHNIAGRLR